ncbi:MAG TPA: lipid A biosynthesis lauroyl acyltransferase [Pararhizobium sp.]|uniref:lysophospholipid acyltransferase family protein n=1 Tax=Pararhizobium sp. TaxID=1977563 RepID=UPI002C8E862A|nr:lipid A biosynthesis lauroyl acyltransferase [Pararhizobium sp.]HTO33050.1 lipid A biosynthesis lauroyl acyltransferase [Pararhizobium sp.]
MKERERHTAATKRQAWVYTAPSAPPLADLFAGGDRRQKALRYHVSGNFKNLFDLAVHFGLKAMPSDWCSAAGAWLGTFAIPRWYAKGVKKARNNLKRLLPNASEAERAAILRRSWQNQGRMMTEFSIVRRLAETPGRVVWHGMDNFVEAHKRGPVIVACLHLGNWELLAPKLVSLGLAPSANYTPPAGRAQAWIARRARLKVGYGLLPPGKDGIRPAINILKDGGVISVFCDEGFAGKIRGPFFGRKPHLEGNLAVVVRLARLTGATICPCYVLRNEGARFEAFALTPLTLPPKDTSASIIDDVGLLNSIIEPIVRANLDQWYFLDNAL